MVEERAMTRRTTEGNLRLTMLDDLRGLTLISMILYHAVWDMVYLFGAKWTWYHGLGAFLWPQSICWTFILLSGFCVSMGKRTLRRGLLVLGAEVLISTVTQLFLPDTIIRFGILSLLGSCMLLTALLRGPLERIRAAVGLPVSLLLFALTRNVNDGFLGFGGWNLMDLPVGWYRGWFTSYLGFPAPWFYSEDYFSLFPWCFLFLAGQFAYRLSKEHGKLRCLAVGGVVPLSLLGRHSLLIYLLHQPLLYILLSTLNSGAV